LIVFFGLINTPVIFQVYINCALCELVNNFYIVYLDDILMFSKFKKEHLHYLELVIKHLCCAELYTNSKKCEFFKFKVKYLGFIINAQDIHMNSACVTAISEWPQSQSFCNIQVFLEFCNFYRCFIYNFSDIVKSLQDLLQGLIKSKKSGLITNK
jgi:Reverse transcriptase (RNA-dependent DNA polymerase)